MTTGADAQAVLSQQSGSCAVRTAPAEGAGLAYVEHGDGQTVIFVHGSLCDYRYWADQLPALSATHRCIAPSLSQYWPNPTPDDAPTFSWSTHVDELATFISHLGEGSVHVVGHSRGGAVALQLAARHPDRVRTLTLADPGGTLRTESSRATTLPPETNLLRARAAELIRYGDPESGLSLFVDSVSRPGSWAQSSQAFRTMALDNAHTLPLQLEDPLPVLEPGIAQRIACPVLLIDGQRSPRMFRNNVDALAKWMPEARRCTIDGASHGMNVTRPAVFNKIVLDFVSEA